MEEEPGAGGQDMGEMLFLPEEQHVLRPGVTRELSGFGDLEPNECEGKEVLDTKW